jgi:hypothetical protein
MVLVLNHRVKIRHFYLTFTHQLLNIPSVSFGKQQRISTWMSQLGFVRLCAKNKRQIKQNACVHARLRSDDDKWMQRHVTFPQICKHNNTFTVSVLYRKTLLCLGVWKYVQISLWSNKSSPIEKNVQVHHPRCVLYIKKGKEVPSKHNCPSFVFIGLTTCFGHLQIKVDVINNEEKNKTYDCI